MMNYLGLAYELVKHCAPSTASVELQAWPDDPAHFPVIIVNPFSAADISNGPLGEGVSFTLAISVYGENAEQAADTAFQLREDIIKAWRDRYRTPYGTVSHISSTATYPVNATNDLDADNAVRFDFELPITARQPNPYT